MRVKLGNVFRLLVALMLLFFIFFLATPMMYFFDWLENDDFSVGDSMLKENLAWIKSLWKKL